MIGNYIRVALRNLSRHRGFSIINISGLAIGMACAVLMLLWVQDELSFDRFHAYVKDLYRVVNEDSGSGTAVHIAVTPAPLAPDLKERFPEVVRATRWGEYGNALVTFGDVSINEKNIALADPDALKMFTFPLVSGDPETALDNDHSILLTEETAERYFGHENPLGKVLVLDKTADFTVTGILQNIPGNSSLNFDFLMPFEFLRNREDIDFWGAYRYYTFVQLYAGSAVNDVNEKVVHEISAHAANSHERLYLQPFASIHLTSDLAYDKMGTGDVKYVWIFSALALLVLAIAAINFMNLATARSATRSREIGLRKVVGAHKLQLVKQFIGESLLVSFIGALLAVVIAEILLPGFCTLSGKQFRSEALIRPATLLGLVSIVLLMGVLSGIYPALVLSSIRPVSALKGIVRGARTRATFRKVLVVVQFALSVGLIIAALVVSDQLTYMRNKDLGFNTDQVIYTSMQECKVEKYKSLKAEMKRIPHVRNVTASFQLPMNIGSSPGEMKWEGKQADQDVRINAGLVDYDYFETFGMKIVDGRAFSEERSSSGSVEYVVNESAVKAMGMKNPIGKTFSFWDSLGTIVGVVKDFNSQPLYKPVNPIVLKLDPYWLNYVYVRIDPVDAQATINSISNTWSQITGGFPFDFHFLDESIENQYRAEQRVSSVLKYFTVFATFVACLGLFGLASFMAGQRTKEIGIRKVFGASSFSVVVLISREFVLLVLLANVIAWPFAYYFTEQWLQDYAYRTTIGVDVFLIAGSIALLTAILSVVAQSTRASRANPVHSLRHE